MPPPTTHLASARYDVRRSVGRRRDRLRDRVRLAVAGILQRRAFASLGSDCELFAIGAGEAALAEAEAWTRRMHDRLTRFSGTSEVSRLNAADGRWLEVSGELESLLRVALDAHERSGGLVNAAVLPALEAAGYS
ncbi:MAG: FAD:protein FMN transferase, partial [Chloroflexi bacterium]|nr:FAD:protein FMN transferase [Chloroflexota bacterium]